MQTIKIVLKNLLFASIIILIYSLSTIFKVTENFFEIIINIKSEGIFNLLLLFSSLIITAKYASGLKEDIFALRFSSKDKFNNYVIKNIIFCNFLLIVFSYLILCFMTFIRGNLNFNIHNYYYGIPNIIYIIYDATISFVLINILCILNIHLMKLLPYFQIVFGIMLIMLSFISTNNFLTINIMNFFGNHLYDSIIHELCNFFFLIVVYGGIDIFLFKLVKEKL